MPFKTKCMFKQIRHVDDLFMIYIMCRELLCRQGCNCELYISSILPVGVYQFITLIMFLLVSQQATVHVSIRNGV